jgi:hypothetical protein
VTVRARLHLAAAFLVAAGAARARDLWADGDASVALRTSLKSSAVLSRAPDDPALFPERVSGESLWRLRLELEARPGPAATAAVAWEQRVRAFSQGAGLEPAASILPRDSPAPYRIRQLDWPIADRPGLLWRHEIDRAFLALHPSGAELTLGRQAIGWGRGVLFGAVDLFSPFSPLEADREWRRGVDAVRADVRLSGRVSLDAVAAFGESIDASCFAARLRGYAGEVDAEIVAGWRARDALLGVTSSAAVGDAEVHGELAVFRTPDALPPGAGGGRWPVKAVAGGSYRLAAGKGLPVFLEYHYSGFGVREPAEALATLADPGYQRRFLRGDTQILGRHVVALLASYEATEELTAGGLLLVSPADGSGVVSPNATVRFGDKMSLQAVLYVPFGALPAGTALRSFYGSVALSGFVQLAVYD